MVHLSFYGMAAVKPKLVSRIRYDHFSAGQFRHGTNSVRSRPEKQLRQCTFEQLTSAADARPLHPSPPQERKGSKFPLFPPCAVKFFRKQPTLLCLPSSTWFGLD
jgi:hypothetical protein